MLKLIGSYQDLQFQLQDLNIDRPKLKHLGDATGINDCLQGEAYLNWLATAFPVAFIDALHCGDWGSAIEVIAQAQARVRWFAYRFDGLTRKEAGCEAV